MFSRRPVSHVEDGDDTARNFDLRFSAALAGMYDDAVNERPQDLTGGGALGRAAPECDLELGNPPAIYLRQIRMQVRNIRWRVEPLPLGVKPLLFRFQVGELCLEGI
ncbi:MAG: hypothetical protein O7F14_10645 [Alphaproteobacteria bacterium]|nr:hypothetical protein [Alphaproteobacteria bacterium]